MKRVVFILLCALLADVAYAQVDEGYLIRKIEEAEAKAKKEREAKERKEREERIKTERRHKEQRRQHEANYNRQMNNLNQVSASDFINPPQQQGSNFSTKVNKFRENQQTPNIVATPKKENGNQTNADPFANSGRIGSASWSGNNYRGNLYDNKRAGFGNAQQRPQIRVPANQIRGQYKPNRKMNQGVVNLQRTNAVPKAKVQGSPQQRNIAQSPQQQRGAQVVRNVQVLQKQQAPVQQQKKVRVTENGKLIIDPSKGPVYITLQKNNSSPDLAMVDTRRIDYATKIGNITVYNVPDEAYHLSDRDNKRPSGYVKGMARDERTESKQAQLFAKDVANGMSSFDNRKKWEYIYDYGYVRSVKTPSRSVTKKR